MGSPLTFGLEDDLWVCLGVLGMAGSRAVVGERYRSKDLVIGAEARAVGLYVREIA